MYRPRTFGCYLGVDDFREESAGDSHFYHAVDSHSTVYPRSIMDLLHGSSYPELHG